MIIFGYEIKMNKKIVYWNDILNIVFDYFSLFKIKQEKIILM
jgi:hypothetical protein